jgi:serine/threonine-protein kinase
MSTDLPTGAELVGYRIEKRLGQGGMGIVYRAEHLELGRKVALKVLSPELAGSKVFRERFIRESRLAASLDHPNVIPIYEAGERDGQLYIAMRFVAGDDLGAILAREGRLEPDRALALLSQVAGALDAAHRKGLVHRDVKPGNILVAPGDGEDADEHCYLCDFGLTKRRGSERELTDAGQFVGTISYVAPEQVEGLPPDGRADVYALGCVLFHCLTGSIPYPREADVAVLYAHLHESTPSANARLPELPAGLDAVFAKALAKEPEDRYPTCAALVRAARAVFEGTAEEAAAPAGEAAEAGAADPGAATVVIAAAERDGVGVDEQDHAADTEELPAVRDTAPLPGAEPTERGPVEAPRRRRGSRRVAGAALIASVLIGGLGIWTFLLTGGTWPPFQAAKATGTTLAPHVVPATTTGSTVAPTPPTRGEDTSTPGSMNGRKAATCVSGWETPDAGVAVRRDGFTIIKSGMGITGSFQVVELRYFKDYDNTEWWYVKAFLDEDLDFKGRWLVQRDAGGVRRIAAVAPYATDGLRSPDWRWFDGKGPAAAYPGLPGKWAGTGYDFVGGGTGVAGGLPSEVRGCMAGT